MITSGPGAANYSVVFQRWCLSLPGNVDPEVDAAG
jgi:hypothetical protein